MSGNGGGVSQFVARGMMPILPTAVTARGSLDETSQRRVVDYCLDCGAVAIGHFGIASEFYKVSDRNRRQLLRCIVRQVAGRVPVFIGVTAPGVETALQYAREAEQLGADLIMAALPYVHLPDANGAFEYYALLGQSVSLPIIIQDTPQSSSILTAELLGKMHDQIARVQYVKVEGKNFVEKAASLMQMTGGRLALIGGACGRHMIHLLRLGVTAFMTGTEALELHAAAVRAYLEGDERRAAAIYYQQILPYLEFYMDYPEELLKWMLWKRGILDCPAVLAPAACPPMGDAERRELEWVLSRIGWQQARNELGAADRPSTE